MSVYIAAYDVSRDRNRRRIAAILSEYGRRVQGSVFEIDVEFEELPELRRQLGMWLESGDLFDLFPIDLRDPRRRVSWIRSPVAREPVTLV